MESNSSFFRDGTVYEALANSDTVLAAMLADVAASQASAASAATSATSAAASAASSASAVQAAAGTSFPLLAGLAAVVGVSTKWAHEDHVHPSEFILASAFGISPNASDNSIPIANAVTYCLANKRALVFTDTSGDYLHSTKLNWGFKDLQVLAFGPVKFRHTGTGVANSFNGITNYPGSQGCTGGVFGGPNKITLKGNPAGGTTVAVEIDNWHMGRMNIAAKDATTAVSFANTGMVGASAVSSWFDIRVSSNVDGAFAVTPGRALDIYGACVCVFENTLVEGCGAGGQTAVVLTDSVRNDFRSGTIESCLAGGISENSGCAHNIYNGFHTESNGTFDWSLAGRGPFLKNCGSSNSPSGSVFNSTAAIVIGCGFEAFVNNDNTLFSVNTKFNGVFTDNGAFSVFIGPYGSDAPASSYDKSLAVLYNKSFNTANGNTFKINSVTVDTVTGTGSTVVLSASPALTGSPTAPTQATGDNSTKIATTAYVDAKVGTATPLASGTAAVGTSAKWAHEDHVHPTDTTRAPLASPALTGTPTAPTAAVDNNTTQVASTAFVLGQAAAASPLAAGTAAPGVSTRYARADHVHPIDTTRAPTASPTFTGTVNSGAITASGDVTCSTSFKPTAAPGTSSHLDSSGVSFIPISNGSSYALDATISYGRITVVDLTNGFMAEYFLSGGTVPTVVLTGNWVASTTTPASGKLSVAYDSGTSRYRIYNNFGSSVNVKPLLVKLH
jgi:hypothetical protein